MKNRISPLVRLSWLSFLLNVFALLGFISCQNPVTSTPSSTNATLSALTLTAGGSSVALSPSFAGATTSYTANVANSVSSVTVAATAVDTGATISGTGSVTLAVGSNTISVVVTAADGSTTKTYAVTLTRAAAGPSSDAGLSALSLTAGGSPVSLSPSFVGATTTYTALVANSVPSVTVAATAVDSGAAISGTGAVTLAVGPNTISVVVTAADGTTTKTYTITVTRAAVGASSDATLSALSLTGGSSVSLSPSFSGATTSYTASVANSVSSVTVAATVTDSGAVISSGTGSVSLAAGANTITVNVTAADATTTKTYTITVTRAAGVAEYVGTWAFASGSVSKSMTFTSGGVVTFTSIGEMIPGNIVTIVFSGTFTVSDTTGIAATHFETETDSLSYIYNSGTDAFGLVGSISYTRSSGTPGTLVGIWTDGTNTLTMNSDHTFTVVDSTDTLISIGTWDDVSSTLTYQALSYAGYSYTATIDMTTTPNTINETKDGFILTKQ